MLEAFVGWEGVGLSSFILINFWYTRCQAVRSAIKALIFNRIGDFGLCLAIGWIYLIFGSLDFATLSLLAPTLLDNSFIWMEWHIGSLNIIGCALSFAATGKSAQLGLHTWLSDAMEGPTPVSALIHAATMVTAGLFLIFRSAIHSVIVVIFYIGAWFLPILPAWYRTT
jgi:NADH-quinone oxidoreductase subunit L